ncbi:MAG: signal peptidase II [Defluviitaleaceae bacterium]|nr:signal peptidase II [Defluviitaleaceae bacterium]
MYLPHFMLAMIIFLSDQACKALVRAKIPLGESVEIVPGKFYIKNIRNHGAANGLFANNRRALMLFTAAAVMSEVRMFFDISKNFRHSKAAWLMFTMKAGGGASNVFDRVTRKYTTDYLHICPRKKSPVFNIADVFILIGALGLLIIYAKRLILSVVTK